MKPHLLYSIGLAAAFLLGLTVGTSSSNPIPQEDPATSAVITSVAATEVTRENPTLTDSLVADLHETWNSEDVPAMSERLHPSAFFFSPHQLMVGRDVMENTVLISNPPVRSSETTAPC